MAELSNDWTVLDQKLKTLNKVMTTKAAIAQTPKELVWTLNKAKLYRYIPVVPEGRAARHSSAAGLRIDESTLHSGSSSRPQLCRVPGESRL